jgi:uncharacterized protein (TIRG00374 family)
MSSEAPPPSPPSGSTKGRVIASIVTLITLVLVFAVILPQFADYGQAWDAIEGMSMASLIVLAVATVANIIVYVWPYQAALPGIAYGPAFVVRQTSFAISNGVPAGGAFGLAVQYDMLSDYGHDSGPATAAIGITSVWNTLVTLGMPVFGVLALALIGDFEARVLGIAVIGLVLMGLAVGALVLIFRSESAARRLGEFADGLIQRVMRIFRRDVDLDLGRKILDFRTSTVEVVRRRVTAVTLTNLLQQLMQFVVLYVALRAIGGSAEVTFAEALVAFSVGRLGSFIPVTPGGLGTVDAAITAILVAFGADEANALAAVMVWRAVTYFPQIFIGIGTFVYWRRRKGRKLAATA